MATKTVSVLRDCADASPFDADAFAVAASRGDDSLRQVRVAFLQRAAEVEAAYEAAAATADERTALEVEFDRVRGDWDAEMAVMQKARDFDQAHSSKDPLYAELHAAQLFGAQCGEVA